METLESIRASLIPGEWEFSHPLPPKLKGVPDTVLTVDNNQKSELKPTQVFPFVGYKYHLDLALAKPTQRDGSIFRI